MSNSPVYPRRRCTFVVAVLCLSLLCLITTGLLSLSNLSLPTSSQAADQLDDLEKARLSEAFHLKETLGDTIWPGWGRAHIPTLLWNEEYAFLIGHSAPPAGWSEVEGDAFQGQPYYRQRWSDPKAFPVLVGDRWVASMSVKTWTQLSLQEQIQDDLPPALKPIFPYRLVLRRYTSDWHIAALLHESFHAYQAEVALARFEDAQRAYRDETLYKSIDLAMREAWQREIDLLIQAVQATSDAEAAELACRFLHQRVQRRQEQGLDPALIAYERRLEWLEGLAKYVELTSWREASAPAYEPLPDLVPDPDFHDYTLFQQRWSQELKQMKRQASREGDSRFYYTGMAQAVLLDRLAPGWKARILSENAWLEELLNEAVTSY
ncbi:MAG TPA: hypothetical protein ENJ31_02820 [Anaerolineae bacterium]|nr:hypothetical protein [Anaerolineae bacterium]